MHTKTKHCYLRYQITKTCDHWQFYLLRIVANVANFWQITDCLTLLSNCPIFKQKSLFIDPISWTTSHGQSKGAQPPVTMTIKGYIIIPIHHIITTSSGELKMKVISVLVLFCYLHIISGGRKYLIQLKNKGEV